MTPIVKFAISAIIIAVVTISTLANIGIELFTPTYTDNISVVRIGYFPNINHAQAVIGIGNGNFQKALGDIKIEPQIFNAGPSAIESLFANRVDITYIGPNPAINGYIKSDGQALRIISGATSGGAVFVVRNDAGITSTSDFAGKKFASPQLGNTQDVALRAYLMSHGHNTKENGGTVEIFPAKNADIVTLMLKKEIDGAWVPEPWGAKLVKEANCRIFLDERDLWPNGEFVSAHIIVNTEFLKNHPEVVKKILRAHVAETIRINEHKEESLHAFNTELKKLTGQTIPEDELQEGFSRMSITYDPIEESLIQSANDAYNIGFLGNEPPILTGIYDLRLLNEVLIEMGLPQIK